MILYPGWRSFFSSLFCYALFQSRKFCGTFFISAIDFCLQDSCYQRSPPERGLPTRPPTVLFSYDTSSCPAFQPGRAVFRPSPDVGIRRIPWRDRPGRFRGAADDGDAAAGVIRVHQGRLIRQTGTTVPGCVKAAPSDVSVTIREVSAANWKADVYDRVPADTDSLC